MGEPGLTGELGRRPLPIQRILGENSSGGRGMQSSGRPDKQVGQNVVTVLFSLRLLLGTNNYIVVWNISFD